MLPDGRTLSLSKDLLKGAIDIHVHAGPHIFSSPRRVDPVEAAQQARDVGMRAIVYMDVFEMSNGTAWLVNKVVKGFHSYGGIILNTVYGGLNPRAVKTALSYGEGAKYVSFGAHSTYYQASREGRLIEGKFVPLSDIYPRFKEELRTTIRIPLESQVQDPRLDEILGLISDAPGVYMITGHTSVPEAMRLIELGKRRGIKQMVVSSAVTKEATDAQLYEMAKHAYIEYTLAAYTHTTTIPKTHYYVEQEYASIDEGMSGEPGGGIRQAAEQIQRIGADRCIICTDFGVYTLPEPVEGLREFIACLLDLGLPATEICKLVKSNPEKLLGLEAS
jgi:hypothetical protein